MFQHNSRLVIIGLMVISTLVLAAPQSVVVLSPNGGEIWAAGTTQMITWNYVGQAEARSFTVHLSIDGGKTFNPITRELPGTARELRWIVSATPTNNAVIKVAAQVPHENPALPTLITVEDVSDGPFKIATK